MGKANVSKTCEVLTDFHMLSHCGKPTVAYYDAQGGCTMALCEDHVKTHTKHVKPFLALPQDTNHE